MSSTRFKRPRQHQLHEKGRPDYEGHHDNEWNDMEDDNNFLNMDPNAEKVSFTSDENAEPNTLQIIMRTEEISVDDDAELLDAETAKADVNRLRECGTCWSRWSGRSLRSLRNR